VQNKEPQREEHDLNVLLRGCVRLSESLARDGRIRLLHNDADEPLRCLIDRVQIEQVLINVLRNAIEAMETAEEGDRVIRATVTRDGEHVLVAIMDRGCGLPNGDESRVFDPFFSTKTGGLGLGLAICRNLVESHGGRIWASPNVGPGSTFYVTLPLVGVARDAH
jgi:signal transduction histidine kinase